MKRPRATRPPFGWHRPLILIVDDTADNLIVMSELLGETYRVKVANSGERALRIATADPRPDLILLDIMMPEIEAVTRCAGVSSSTPSPAVFP